MDPLVILFGRGVGILQGTVDLGVSQWVASFGLPALAGVTAALIHRIRPIHARSCSDVPTTEAAPA